MMSLKLNFRSALQPRRRKRSLTPESEGEETDSRRHLIPPGLRDREPVPDTEATTLFAAPPAPMSNPDQLRLARSASHEAADMLLDLQRQQRDVKRLLIGVRLDITQDVLADTDLVDSFDELLDSFEAMDSPGEDEKAGVEKRGNVSSTDPVKNPGPIDDFAVALQILGLEADDHGSWTGWEHMETSLLLSQVSRRP